MLAAHLVLDFYFKGIDKKEYRKPEHAECSGFLFEWFIKIRRAIPQKRYCPSSLY